MKNKCKISSLIAGLTLAASSSLLHAADDVTLQLKWVTQAQFAGYFVAQDQGFYEAENLNVTINPGGPDVSPTGDCRWWCRRRDRLDAFSPSF